LLGVATLTLVSVYCLAKLLVPSRPFFHWLAMAILLGNLFWIRFAVSIRFESLVGLCVVWSLFGLFIWQLRQQRWGWWLLWIALGLGVMAKGPVIYLFTLPICLLFPVFYPQSRLGIYYGSVMGAVGLSLLIPSAWLLRLYQMGYPVSDIHYMAGHVADYFRWLHFRPEMLTNLLVHFGPWLLLCAIAWRSAALWRQEPWLKLLAWALLPAVVFFACFSEYPGVRYLEPLYPLIALILARMFDMACLYSLPTRRHMLPLTLALAFLCVLCLSGNLYPYFHLGAKLAGSLLVVSLVAVLVFAAQCLKRCNAYFLGSVYCFANVLLCLALTKLV